ncbi:hypothetical protein DYU11_08145 [Fibrisoma montanum]|uniref:IPT/TIG domain-containing protein n=1 Tax=Fibrisoma montanum TaxID=2305895 RepID=A0A418MEP2_9BACT|nr:IPT/TIG domain-containing protein [Fibrisoma montanum]RIV25268.1 hypothetical protein DYU11_08145 [Fibrisoma montanum]
MKSYLSLLLAAMTLSLAGCKKESDEVHPQEPAVPQPAISYLQVAEETGPGGGNSELIIYGSNFGAQNKATSKVRINNQVLGAEYIALWGNNIIVCRIPASGDNSSGQVTVTNGEGGVSPARVLNEWTVIMYFNRPCARNDQTLSFSTATYVRLRGDALPAPAGLKLVLDKTAGGAANFTSRVDWEARGEGTSVLNNEEWCGTEKEVWTKTTGTIYLSTGANPPTREKYFNVEVYQIPGKGFELTMEYLAAGVIPSSFVATTCTGYETSTNRPASVYFPSEMDRERYQLLFDGTSLKSGESQTYKLGIGSMNLHTNGADPAWTPSVKVVWGSTPAKY